MADLPGHEAPSHAKLGLWDAVSIIIGIVIGSTTYKTPPVIFENVPSAWAAMGLWLVGGIVSLVGALCYAELATTYPRSGGDYVYLTRAFGPATGFLFGWAQLAVILTGSTGAMAFIFGEYAVALFDVAPDHQQAVIVWSGVAAVLILSAMNLMGVLLERWVQNALSLAKMLGLIGIVVVGFLWSPPGETSHAAWTEQRPVQQGIGVAMILILYAYGGWNDAAFVAAEMRDRRSMATALVLGTGLVTVIYLLVNAAYLLTLGFDGARQFRPTIASDVFKIYWGPWGARAMDVLVMISALGAINGLVFAGSRVYFTLGSEHSVFAWLGKWNERLGAPVRSIVAQAAITTSMIFVVGTTQGQGAIDHALTAVGLRAIPWGDYYGGFNTLFAGTAPVFWAFFLLTGISVFVLRAKDPDLERPFRLTTPFYPVLPLVFCGMCLFGLYSACTHAKYVSIIGVLPLLAGVPLYLLSRRREAKGGLPTDDGE